MKHQTITTDGGEELIVLTRRAYDALLAAAGDEEAEDRAMVRLTEEVLARNEPSYPSSFAMPLMNGATPVRAARKHAGLTQPALAAAVGITQGYLSDIERGTKRGADDVLARIAAATGVDPAWLRPKGGEVRPHSVGGGP